MKAKTQCPKRSNSSVTVITRAAATSAEPRHEIVKLQVPETLLVEDESMFLFTDSTGTLRVVRGEMAMTDFMAMAGENTTMNKHGRKCQAYAPECATDG